MSKYYQNQELVLRLDTGVDLSTATDLKIKCENPDGTITEQGGTVYSVTHIEATFTLTQTGFHRFQAYATLGAVEYPGETFKMHVYAPFG